MIMIESIKALLIIILLIQISINCISLDENQEKTSLLLSIEHSIDNGLTYSNRSMLSVLLPSFRHLGIDTKKDKERNGLYDNDIEGFKLLLQNNSFYKIRVKSNQKNEKSPYITAAIPACELQKSGFKEDIVIYMDKNENIISLVYSSPVAALSKPCDATKVKSPTNLLSKIRIADPVNAQSVPLQAIGPKPGNLNNINVEATVVDSDGNTVEQPQKPQQSWFRRNWYLFALAGYYIYRFTSMEPAPAEQPKQQQNSKKNN